MKRLAVTAAAIVALTSALVAQRGTPSKPLEIYVVDTEGGKAALWVAPGGQSLLIDSGNPGNRDLDRIMAADQRRRREADRLSDLDPLPRRSHRRLAGARQADSDRALHRSRADRRANESRCRVFRRRTPSCTARRSTRSSKPGDKMPDHRPRLADRDIRRPGPEDAASRRRASRIPRARASRRKTCRRPMTTDSRSAA